MALAPGEHGEVAAVFRCFHQYSTPVVTEDGVTYVARVYGQQQSGGLWEAWFVFFPVTGGEALATDRETTQSKESDVLYWASGITPTYLEGALRRALDRRPDARLARRAAWAEREAAYHRAELEAYRLAAEDALAQARLADAARRVAEKALAERRRPRRAS
jgi:hypothetical protein